MSGQITNSDQLCCCVAVLNACLLLCQPSHQLVPKRLLIGNVRCPAGPEPYICTSAAAERSHAGDEVYHSFWLSFAASCCCCVSSAPVLLHLCRPASAPEELLRCSSMLCQHYQNLLVKSLLAHARKNLCAGGKCRVTVLIAFWSVPQ